MHEVTSTLRASLTPPDNRRTAPTTPKVGPSTANKSDSGKNDQAFFSSPFSLQAIALFNAAFPCYKQRKPARAHAQRGSSHRFIHACGKFGVRFNLLRPGRGSSDRWPGALPVMACASIDACRTASEISDQDHDASVRGGASRGLFVSPGVSIFCALWEVAAKLVVELECNTRRVVCPWSLLRGIPCGCDITQFWSFSRGRWLQLFSLGSVLKLHVLSASSKDTTNDAWQEARHPRG
jgi:hypothetical protein